MWTYYFVVIYIAVIVGFINPMVKENKKTKLLFALVPLFVYAAIRGNGNGDYFNYINRGQYVNSISDIFMCDIGMEIGYKFLSYIIKCMRLPRQTIIIIFNVISAVCLNSYVKKYSKHWTLSLLLYLPIFFQFEMHAARTGVAISIIFCGMKDIEERKLLKYIGFVFLATCFHLTAFIALALYWLYNLKIKKQVGILLLLVDIYISMFIGIDKVVISIMSSLHLKTILAKYLAYSSSLEYGYAMNMFDPRILMGVLIYLVCTCSIVKINNSDNFSLNCIFMYVILLIMFREHTFIAYRVSSYFYYPIIALIPKLVADNNLVFGGKKGSCVMMFYSVIFLFTALNMVYASQNPEYILFWKNGQAIKPW